MSFSRASDAVLKGVNKVMGDTVTYTYSVGGSTEIKAVFDNAFVDPYNVATRKPILKNVRLADLDHDPVPGDTVEVNSTEYTVVQIEPDSYGSAILHLEEA